MYWRPVPAECTRWNWQGVRPGIAITVRTGLLASLDVAKLPSSAPNLEIFSNGPELGLMLRSAPCPSHQRSPVGTASAVLKNATNCVGAVLSVVGVSLPVCLAWRAG